MRRSSYILFGISGGVGALTLVSFSLGLFAGLEYFFEDLLVSPKPVSEELVIVAIDDESLQRLGQWPWPRALFAEALEALDRHPPDAVGIDVVFAESSRLGAADDQALAAALADLSYPVVLPAEAAPLMLESGKPPEAGRWVLPRTEFTGFEAASLGHVNLILDYDGVARRFPVAIAPPLPGDGPVRIFAEEMLDRAGRTIAPALAEGAVERIVYSAPTGSIRRIPFWRLLEEGEDILPVLKDKIVLMGATAADLHDTKLTPFSRGSEMPGVEIQANIVNMLLSGERLHDLGRGLMSFWILAAAFLPAFFFMHWSRSLRPLYANIALGISHTAAAVMFFEEGLAADLVHLNGAWILSAASLFSYRYFLGEKERREITHLFSKYVSADVLGEMLKDPAAVKLGGEEKEVTVLFSDIRGFTTLSEKMAPQELVRALNRYFSRMSEQIIAHRGVLDKYIGDAIMAFWGAPLEDSEQADHALEAAFGMARELEALNRELRVLGDPEIKIGIGLYTGPAVAGNIGSEFRFNYTIIGDTVNVASRLEGLTKEYQTTLIIGESTKNKIKKDTPFTFLGETTVKGRKEPVRIYTVAT